MFAAIHIPGIDAHGSADLLAVAQSFSPTVESDGAGTAVIPVAGLRRLIGPPHQIASEIARRCAERRLTGSIGIASNPDTAILAARNRPGVTIIPRGDEPKYIGEFRIGTLPVDPETCDVLERWGVRTLEDLSALPDDGVHERLGPAAVYLLELARGTAQRPLRLFTDPTGYQERQELEYPAEILEGLLFVIGRQVNELCARLLRHTMATTEVRLKLDLEAAEPNERTLQLPFATRDARALLKLLQLDLEAHPPAAPVVAVTLSVVPVDARTVQHGLFVPAAPEPEKLELTLQKIRGLVGAANAGSPELLDTHRPNAWRMMPVNFQSAPENGQLTLPGCRLAFRHFTPVLRARVELRERRPARVFSDRVYGSVLQSAGPWRSCGDWWRDTAWDRDEWDVNLNDGAVYRIFLDRPARQWFVEGAYD